MTTEAEAKTKWCPFVRYVVPHQDNNTAVNRWLSESDKQPNPEPARCIGSECMAWRWHETPRTEYPATIGSGHCGLAGKP